MIGLGFLSGALPLQVRYWPCLQVQHPIAKSRQGSALASYNSKDQCKRQQIYIQVNVLACETGALHKTVASICADSELRLGLAAKVLVCLQLQASPSIQALASVLQPMKSRQSRGVRHCAHADVYVYGTLKWQYRFKQVHITTS